MIGLSTFDDDEIAQIVCAAGAETLVSKSASTAELIKAIFGLGAGRREVEDAAAFAGLLASPPPLSPMRSR